MVFNFFQQPEFIIKKVLLFFFFLKKKVLYNIRFCLKHMYKIFEKTQITIFFILFDLRYYRYIFNLKIIYMQCIIVLYVLYFLSYKKLMKYFNDNKVSWKYITLYICLDNCLTAKNLVFYFLFNRSFDSWGYWHLICYLT